MDNKNSEEMTYTIKCPVSSCSTDKTYSVIWKAYTRSTKNKKGEEVSKLCQPRWFFSSLKNHFEKCHLDTLPINSPPSNNPSTNDTLSNNASNPPINNAINNNSSNNNSAINLADNPPTHNADNPPTNNTENPPNNPTTNNPVFNISNNPATKNDNNPSTNDTSSPIDIEQNANFEFEVPILCESEYSSTEAMSSQPTSVESLTSSRTTSDIIEALISKPSDRRDVSFGVKSKVTRVRKRREVPTKSSKNASSLPAKRRRK